MKKREQQILRLTDGELSQTKRGCKGQWKVTTDDEGSNISSSEAEDDFGDLEDILPPRAMEEFRDCLLGRFEQYQSKRVPNGTHDQSTQGGVEGSFQAGHSVTHFTQGGGQGNKQPRRSSASNNDNNEDGEGGEGATPGSLPTEENDDDNRCFACPFHKRSPEAHPRCGKVVLRTVTRMKEHIWRMHDLGIHCYVCYQQFKGEPEQRDHMRAQDCQKLERPPKDTITLEQRKQIKRRADPRKTKVQLWFDIFHILFPEADLPSSPYVDSLLSATGDLASVRNFFFQNGRAIFEEQAKERFPPNLLRHREVVEKIYNAVFEDTISVLLDRFERSQQKRSTTASTAGGGNYVSSKTQMLPSLNGPGGNPDLEMETPMPLAGNDSSQLAFLADSSVQSFAEPSSPDQGYMSYLNDVDLHMQDNFDGMDSSNFNDGNFYGLPPQNYP